MRASAKAKNISQSYWVANLIREKCQTEWPDHIAALAGARTDFPALEEIYGEISTDVARESL